MTPQKSSYQQSLRLLACMSQFSGELLAYMALGLAVDWLWTNSRWGVVLFALVGLVVSFYRLVRNLRMAINQREDHPK